MRRFACIGGRDLVQLVEGGSFLEVLGVSGQAGAGLTIDDGLEVLVVGQLVGDGVVEDDDRCQELNDAIHGLGAFRMFRAAIRRVGLEDDGYEFKDESFARIVFDWLEVGDRVRG